jgi:hypothetical protein
MFSLYDPIDKSMGSGLLVLRAETYPPAAMGQHTMDLDMIATILNVVTLPQF